MEAPAAAAIDPVGVQPRSRPRAPPAAGGRCGGPTPDGASEEPMPDVDVLCDLLELQESGFSVSWQHHSGLPKPRLWSRPLAELYIQTRTIVTTAQPNHLISKSVCLTVGATAQLAWGETRFAGYEASCLQQNPRDS